MSDGSSDLTPEAVVRAIAINETLSLAELRKKLLEEHAAAFRWLTASLLAVNAGSLIAIIGNTGQSATTKLWACSAFMLGVVFSLLCGYWSQGAAVRTLGPLNKLWRYWIQVSVEGFQVAPLHDSIVAELQASARRSTRVKGAGWAAVAAFVAGGAVVGYSLFQESGSLESASRRKSPTAAQGDSAGPTP